MPASYPDPDADPDFCYESQVRLQVTGGRWQVAGHRWQVTGHGLQGFGVPWGCCVFRNLKPETCNLEHTPNQSPIGKPIFSNADFESQPRFLP
jgi:hypothetical protein